jgi:MinD superfamily P-loop ATPase
MICINKYDLNNDNTKEIEKFCRENEISVVAKIPYDMDFVKAQIEKKSILEFSDSIASAEIKNMWSNIMNELL